MGIPIPARFEDTAELVDIRWPTSDEAALLGIAKDFFRAGVALREDQMVVHLDTESMLAVNDSEGLDAFSSFRDDVTIGPGTTGSRVT